MESPEAQGRSGISEKGSRGSWGCLGLDPKPLLFGGKLVIKTKVLELGRFCYGMKGLSGLRVKQTKKKLHGFQ